MGFLYSVDCPNCGVHIENVKKICPRCGANIEDAAEDAKSRSTAFAKAIPAAIVAYLALRVIAPGFSMIGALFVLIGAGFYFVNKRDAQ